MNSFLYENSFPTLLDGILRHPLSLVDTRSVTTITDTREDDQDARGMEDAKTVAWKRRRKRGKDTGSGSTTRSHLGVSVALLGHAKARATILAI